MTLVVAKPEVYLTEAHRLTDGQKLDALNFIQEAYNCNL